MGIGREKGVGSLIWPQLQAGVNFYRESHCQANIYPINQVLYVKPDQPPPTLPDIRPKIQASARGKCQSVGRFRKHWLSIGPADDQMSSQICSKVSRCSHSSGTTFSRRRLWPQKVSSDRRSRACGDSGSSIFRCRISDLTEATNLWWTSFMRVTVLSRGQMSTTDSYNLAS